VAATVLAIVMCSPGNDERRLYAVTQADQCVIQAGGTVKVVYILFQVVQVPQSACQPPR